MVSGSEQFVIGRACVVMMTGELVDAHTFCVGRTCGSFPSYHTTVAGLFPRDKYSLVPHFPRTVVWCVSDLRATLA